MSGVGKFKLTDALPKNQVPIQGDEASRGPQTKGKTPGKPRNKKAPAGQARSTPDQNADQLREARESAKAKNAGASARDHMVDIGRGNQQAGRQKAK